MAPQAPSFPHLGAALTDERGAGNLQSQPDTSPTRQDGGDMHPMFGGSPDDYAKALAEHQAAHERAEAERDETGHLVARVLNTLDEDQCRAVDAVLKSIRSSGNYSSAEAVTASFYIGVLTSRLHEVFGVCLSCHEKHDDAIAELLSAPDGAS